MFHFFGAISRLVLHGNLYFIHSSVDLKKFYILDNSISKDILKSELLAGRRPAVELLYTRYSGMLFSFILQWVPDRDEAGGLLAEVFVKLTPRLQQALDADVSLYCWLQAETRKIVLDRMGEKVGESVGRGDERYYFSLLEEASPQQRWVFRELFLCGRGKEELAVRSGRDPGYISRTLREALQIIRNKLA